MGRRSSFIEDVMGLPWQVGVVLAVLCYPIALLIEWHFNKQEITQALGMTAMRFWPWVAGMFLFAALISYIRGLQKKKLYRQHQYIDKVRALSWQQFEEFMGQYFREQGYSVVETADGPDGGIDLVLRKDGEKSYVQCKHWKAST
ncbi:MAG: restriction endonuclease, partial [Xanthomonadales bacterium]|nr:restriction endonuclease [Xanthomonadales bacterium]